MVIARSLQDSIWVLFLITSTHFLISKEIYDLCEITKKVKLDKEGNNFSAT